jgi:hypothetical protein
MVSVKITTDLSIFIQILTGFVSMQGIFIKLPEKHKVLNEVLMAETFVQAIELIFYTYFLKSLAITSLPQMASVRYFDWVITTPTMLLTTIVYFKYEEYIEKNRDEILHVTDFFKENIQNVITIILCNFLMLLFGYLGEVGAIDMVTSIIVGFIFFGITFYTIYKDYATKSQQSMKIFKFIFSIWTLYGLAAILSPYQKNIMFNVLDIFAKNFFGLYLFYKINTLANDPITP